MNWTKERILIVAKAYPALGRKHGEMVCSAGITDTGEWRRLFPIHFRSLSREKQFSKFDWIEVETQPAAEKLMRKESRRVKEESIRIIEHLNVSGLSEAKKQAMWRTRKNILLPVLSLSLEELQKQFDQDKTSLGIIKPAKIIDFIRKPVSGVREWERDLVEGRQTTLNPSGYETPLDKIPFWLGYRFSCQDPACGEHETMCEDWEMLQLYREMRRKWKTDEIAFEKVREKYFDWMRKRDAYFVVGTESQFGKFLIISVFYPPVGGPLERFLGSR